MDEEREANIGRKPFQMADDWSHIPPDEIMHMLAMQARWEKDQSRVGDLGRRSFKKREVPFF